MFKNFWAKVRVVLSAAVTYITIITVAATAFVSQFGDLLPDSWHWITDWILKAVVVLAGAVAIIRRVTPVLPADRGILPNDPSPTS